MSVYRGGNEVRESSMKAFCGPFHGGKAHLTFNSGASRRAAAFALLCGITLLVGSLLPECAVAQTASWVGGVSGGCPPVNITSSGPSAPAICTQFAPFQAAVAACQNIPPHYSGSYYFGFFTYNRSELPPSNRVNFPGPDQLHEAFCVFYQQQYTDGALKQEYSNVDGGGLTCPGNSFPGRFDNSCTCWPSQTWVPAQNKCVSVVDGGGASNPPPGGCSSNPPAGNPIYPMFGSKREPLDLGIALAGTTFRLTYDTLDKASTIAGIDGPKRARPGAFGDLWDSNLHRQIIFQAGSGGARASRGNGTTVSFLESGSFVFTPEAGSTDQLTLVTGGYRYVDRQAKTQELYDYTGHLTKISWIDGRFIAMTYSTSTTPVAVAPAPGYLIQATDQNGRTISFNYIVLPGTDFSLDARVSTIIDTVGQQTKIAYDGTGNLSGVTWPDNYSRTFLYERADIPWAMTGVIDERQIRYATFAYDSAGRAISTEYAGGVNKFSVSYTTPPSIQYSDVYNASTQILTRNYDWAPPTGTLLVDPLGSSGAMSSSTIHGKTYRTSQGQPAGSGCSASTSYVTYDANGNLASDDDFNGHRICHVSDLSRNVETMRVEGLANVAVCASLTTVGTTIPTNSRRISTQWHPDWPLEAKRAEPRMLTTWVYNGQPDPFNGGTIASCAPTTALLQDGKPVVVLCKQVEQATTDVDGHLGFSASLQGGVPNFQQSWTYNASGQVLTSKGARSDVNDTTSYVYYTTSTTDYTVGDISQITNPAGQATTYPKYTKFGQALRSIDANTLITDSTYDVRQRLKTRSAGGLLTTYAYDAAGQLTTLAQPDTSAITYTYDDAHRLTKVVDQAGNSITYTLDNAGNRTQEQVKDASNVLRRTVTRTFDALGRIQQVVGAPN
jgi:YD repeat-containing protein